MSKEQPTVYFVSQYGDDFQKFDSLEEAADWIKDQAERNDSSLGDYTVYAGSRYGYAVTEYKVTIERA